MVVAFKNTDYEDLRCYLEMMADLKEATGRGCMVVFKNTDLTIHVRKVGHKVVLIKSPL